MVPDYRYTQDEVCALLYDSPKTAVRETLHLLVERGAIWRDTSHARVTYLRPSEAALQAEIERKAVRAERPSWMDATLTGYEASLAQRRELAMAARS